jgi:erythronate-4-phosphate dehydrogenase
MKIVCCSNMPFAREAFSTLGDVLVKDGRTITAEDARDATILAIRSTLRVDRALLDGSSVKFVGTATIGIDHMDTAWFDQKGIKWCYAPGCNANSVSEYVTTALLCLANRHGLKLEGKTIGVVGVGNVGSLVVKKAEALGMRVLQNDPPRERGIGVSECRSVGVGKTEVSLSAVALAKAEGQRSNDRQQTTDDGQLTTDARFVSLEQILAESDIVTMHVPLTKDGPDKTLRMADTKFFAAMKPSCIFLNSARGGAVVTDTLLTAIGKESVSRTVIDTWEGEPTYRKDLMEKADIGTPHIAGHSFEGKVMGTVMVYRSACEFLGVKPSWTPDNLLPPPLVPEINLDVKGMSDEKALWELVRRVYDIEADDRRLREGCVADNKARAAHFDDLRRNYPVRREFRFTRVAAKNASRKLLAKITGLGFAIK